MIKSEHIPNLENVVRIIIVWSECHERIWKTARRKILCTRFSTKSRMALENRADSGLNPLITESHSGQNGMRAGAA